VLPTIVCHKVENGCFELPARREGSVIVGTAETKVRRLLVYIVYKNIDYSRLIDASLLAVKKYSYSPRWQ